MQMLCHVSSPLQSSTVFDMQPELIGGGRWLVEPVRAGRLPVSSIATLLWQNRHQFHLSGSGLHLKRRSGYICLAPRNWPEQYEIDLGKTPFARFLRAETHKQALELVV